MTEADFRSIGNYALMLLPDQNIDRHTCRRVVPMEVFSFGFSRTGTLTMQRALEILGYPTYHFSNLFGNVKDADMWFEAYQVKWSGKGEFGRGQWDQLLGHVGAVTDGPAYQFAHELIEAYPDAKIVLVERDVDSWYKSMKGFCDAAFSPAVPVLRTLDPYWYGRIWAVGDAWFKTGFNATTKDAILANAKEVYEKHYEDMRVIAKAHNVPMLEYRLGDGWEPLCKFLGKEIPKEKTRETGEVREVKFPHLNETQSINKMFTVMATKSLTSIFKNFAVVGSATGILAWAAWRVYKRRV